MIIHPTYGVYCGNSSLVEFKSPFMQFESSLVQKPFDVIPHINRMKLTILSIDTEKTSNKIQYLFMAKAKHTRNLKLLNLIEGTFKNLQQKYKELLANTTKTYMLTSCKT